MSGKSQNERCRAILLMLWVLLSPDMDERNEESMQKQLIEEGILAFHEIHRFDNSDNDFNTLRSQLLRILPTIAITPRPNSPSLLPVTGSLNTKTVPSTSNAEFHHLDDSTSSSQKDGMIATDTITQNASSVPNVRNFRRGQTAASDNYGSTSQAFSSTTNNPTVPETRALRGQMAKTITTASKAKSGKNALKTNRGQKKSKTIVIPDMYRWNDENINSNITGFNSFHEGSFTSIEESIAADMGLMRNLEDNSIPLKQQIGEDDVTSMWAALLQIKSSVESGEALKRMREAQFGYHVEAYFRYAVEN